MHIQPVLGGLAVLAMGLELAVRFVVAGVARTLVVELEGSEELAALLLLALVGGLGLVHVGGGLSVVGVSAWASPSRDFCGGGSAFLRFRARVPLRLMENAPVVLGFKGMVGGVACARVCERVCAWVC